MIVEKKISLTVYSQISVSIINLFFSFLLPGKQIQIFFSSKRENIVHRNKVTSNDIYL